MTSAFSRKLKIYLRLLALLTVLAVQSQILPSANAQTPAIRLRVDNYTQASAAILAKAEREAGRILREAGLRTVWLDCPVGHSTAVPQDPCQEPPEATDISLRVLSEPTRNRFQDAVFGFAVHPVLASVYYDSVVRLAKSHDAEFEIPIILGCIIAHEIGHLLLGSNGHSTEGVMQPQWERKQIRQAMTGTLLFTPEQAKLIQAETQLRMRLQTASLLAKYPTNALGEWTWVLVRSEDWRRILLDRGFKPDTSPAFSILPNRETFFEGALLAKVSNRGVELSGLWHMRIEDLLDLAVRHELGHALCNETDEAKANRIARFLQGPKPVSCEVKPAAKDHSDEIVRVVPGAALAREVVVIGGTEPQGRFVSCVAEVSADELRKLPNSDQPMTLVILEHRKFLQTRDAFHAYRTTLLGPAQDPPATVSVNPEVTISVHNYADIPTALLSAAEDQARKIFQHAGLETVWLNCSPKLERLEPRSCYFADTTHLTLKISPHAVNAQVRDRIDVLGTAYPDENGAGYFAYVFYDRVQELAQRRRLGHALLAAVMAHEIGHLLLGSNSHSVSGIMCAHWSDKELRNVSEGAMSFVPAQSRIMRNQLRARQSGRMDLAPIG